MNPIDDRALDSMSVAPADPDATSLPAGLGNPRQDAGQDESIARRMQKDPDNVDARLDNGLDETMDGSDPVSISQPGVSSDPAPSSGYDPEAEGKQ